MREDKVKIGNYVKNYAEVYIHLLPEINWN